MALIITVIYRSVKMQKWFLYDDFYITAQSTKLQELVYAYLQQYSSKRHWDNLHIYSTHMLTEVKVWKNKFISQNLRPKFIEKWIHSAH
jgi:hypothetical protein